VSVSVLAEKIGQRQNIPIVAFGGALYNQDRISADRGQRAMSVSAATVTESSGPNINMVWINLPGTKTEVENLQALVSPQNIRVFLGRDVSEAQIKNLSKMGELTRYQIIHLACHGYFDEADAERSGIVLSEVSGLLSTGEDGYLTIPEIVLLNMNARMVLLSACETGLGVLKRGDGMVGMARAFLVSGVENVGVSLWSISDEATLDFMTRLYGKVLNEVKTFKEAYYLTKNEFRKDPKWSHPYYWAAFTMYE
jgi:CHAT domain-containing protein